MADPNIVKGPGMLYVTARISRKDIMDQDTYMNWYDNDHIAEIIEKSGVNSAFRYYNCDKDAAWPYLAFYPMKDTAFTLTDEFRTIRVKSDLLPGSQLCYDLADNNVRYLGLYDKVGSRKGTAKGLVNTAIEPAAGTSDADAEKSMKTVQQAMSKVPGYSRTTFYKLLYARSNAQSRKLKGLPMTSDEPDPEPPTLLALHEFDRELDASAVEGVKNDEPVKKILADAKQQEFVVYKLAKPHGDGSWLD